MKASEVVEPIPMLTPIALNGSRDSIPQEQADAEQNWFCSIENGFPDITMLAPKDGGQPPRGQGINGLFYLVSDQKCYLQHGGIITFSQTVSDLIGGYPSGAILDYYTADNKAFTKVVSLIDNNTNNFVANPSLIDGVRWAYASFGGANQDISNLSVYGNSRLHALKGYLDEGELLTDAEGLADVINYAHSTFDISKFEVVGAPVITDNGIQNISTGNPYNNYVKSPAITFGSTFDVNVGFTVNSINSACRILGETNSLLRVFTNANGSALDVRFETSNGDTIVLADSVNLGTIVQHFVTVNVAFTGTSYIIKIYKDRNLAYTNTVNSTLFPRYTSINTQGTNTNTPQNYSIDLKQFKIIVNELTVFAGNRTGVDNYTINGSSVAIPYAESKTGSKIVDSAYRSQVQLLYEQEGDSPYYILDEVNGNYTIPAGELYGKIAKKANDNAVVHLTGNETIAGEKTFTSRTTFGEHITEVSGIANIHLRSIDPSADWTQNPSSDLLYNRLISYDKNNIVITLLENYQTTNGYKGAHLLVRNPANDTFGILRLGVAPSNHFYTEAPACDFVNSIVTTLGISKSKNGYVKLGNGIIIQWGLTSAQGANTHQTVTLPIAFSTLSYRVLTTFFGGGDVDDNAIVISQTFGDFVIYRTQVGANDNPWSLSVSWIAIGW